MLSRKAFLTTMADLAKKEGKPKRELPRIVIYFELVVGVFILSGINYVFTKLVDNISKTGISDVNGTEYWIFWVFVFIVGFAFYLRLIDLRGTIARMLGQGGGEPWTMHAKKAGLELEVSGATRVEVEEMFNKAVEKLKPSEPGQQGTPQPRNNMERVKMAWDMKRDMILNSLVMVFAAYLTITQIISAFPTDTTFWVVARLATPLLVFAYVVSVIKGFGRKLSELATTTEARLQNVESGGQTPGLDELLDPDRNA